jgi:hypothetical protein
MVARVRAFNSDTVSELSHRAAHPGTNIRRLPQPRLRLRGPRAPLPGGKHCVHLIPIRLTWRYDGGLCRHHRAFMTPEQKARQEIDQQLDACASIAHSVQQPGGLGELHNRIGMDRVSRVILPLTPSGVEHMSALSLRYGCEM